MNIDNINQVRNLIQWVKENTEKSANFEINFWAFRSDGAESVEYSVWIDGLVHKKTKCLDAMVKLIPNIKQLCSLNKELAA